MKMNYLIFSVITLAVCDVARTSEAQIVFPEKFHLPPPTACEDEDQFCGNDPQKYPLDQIKKIVDRSIELQIAPETAERFFGLEQPGSSPVEGDLISTCDHRNELVPRFARARNVLGKWVYLVEGSKDRRQFVSIVVCSKTDVPCKNDIDSPHGEGTTVCRQLYRTQKLLALDETGEMVVDTFKVPSACICNYKGQFGAHLRDGFGAAANVKQAPKCSVDNATQNLEAPDIRPEDQRGVHRLKVDDFSGEIDPCEEGSLLCDADDQTYPRNLIEKMLRTHVAFKSPKFFGTIFGDICQPTELKVATRAGFELQEQELCTSFQKYIYPKKAKTVKGDWHYIINTDEYRQGVTIETCIGRAKDESCLYGGLEGNDPGSTVCKQGYSVHHFLAVKATGEVSYEPFQIPSSCSCFINDRDFFALE